MRRRHRRPVIHPYMPGRSRCFSHTEKLLSRTEGRHPVLISPLRSGQGPNADASIGGVGIIGGGRSQRSEVVFVLFVLFVVFVLFTRDYASVRLRCAGFALLILRTFVRPPRGRNIRYALPRDSLTLIPRGTVVPFKACFDSSGVVVLVSSSCFFFRVFSLRWLRSGGSAAEKKVLI